MSSFFKLHAKCDLASDQPQAIHKLIKGVNDGLAYQTLPGVIGLGKYLLLLT